ncbi:MAG: dockerin type I repeat-containing protein [Oscillospiraceae bacterium]|nr:dockerin type I repeat-containing protein [Oscillospiraceae bacterium]
MKKRILSILLAICLLLTLMPSVLAEDTAACEISVRDTALTEKSLTTGELWTVTLSDVFTDSEGHAMTYALSGVDPDDQVGITEDGVFKFSVSAAGTYTPTITATCAGDPSMTATYSPTITVTAAQEGSEDQYDYDETPAGSVTVTFTLSNDGIPLLGNDENHTTLANLTVTVPYFDLAEYGLEDYYRYGTDGGSGAYTGSNVIERPTAMHLFLYVLERYYMGLPADQCGKGTSGVLSYAQETTERYMDGSEAYTSGTYQALTYTGSATSTYMQNFWGHDENLMYYRNHVYPLMSAGWGATSDYMLLSDGDTIDVAMFSNWSFYTGGFFACFDRNTYTAEAGTALDFKTMKYETSSVAEGGTETMEPATGLNVTVYNDQWQKIGDPITSQTSDFCFTFPSSGTYYLLATDPNGKTSDAGKAPGTAKVTVTGAAAVVYGDISGDGKIKAADALSVYAYLNGSAEFTAAQKQAADVSGDGKINARDALLIYQYVNGGITSFPAEG